MDDIKVSMDHYSGGYVRPSYGTVRLSQEIFNDDFPPPVTVQISILADINGSDQQIINGVGHLLRYDSTGVEYSLYGDSFSTMISDHTFDDNLINIFNWACESSRLNLSLDHSAARLPSPAVYYQVTGEHQLIDVLDTIAGFFCHFFEIKDSVLRLGDMLVPTGQPIFLGYFDAFTSPHAGPQAYSLFTAGSESVSGVYHYGVPFEINPVCHNASSNIQDALADIKTILSKRWLSKSIPLSSGPPEIGAQLQWTDNRLIKDVFCTMTVRALTYHWGAVGDVPKIFIEGEGDEVLA